MNYTSYLVQKILTKDEWEEIMEYPETNYARISNYLKCRFLTEEIRNTILSQLTLF